MKPQLNKKRLIITAVIALLLILFLPVPKGTLEDGGTRVYAARLYKIVAWNKIVAYEDPNPLLSDNLKTIRYQKTAVYWFAESQRSIDELWEIEFERNKDAILRS